MKKKHADYSKIKDILEKEFKKLDTKCASLAKRG